MSIPKNMVRFKPTPTIMHYQPPPAVVELGRPDRVFGGSAGTAAKIRKILWSIGMSCIAVVIGSILAFFVFAPAELHADALALGLLSFGTAFFLVVGGLVIYGARDAYWRWRPSCYLIYAHGMAFTQGKDWTVLDWEDVRAYCFQGVPYLLMKDGRRILVDEPASYGGELLELIEDHLLEICASRGVPLETAAELVDPEPVPQQAVSPVSMIFGGALVAIAAGWFFSYLKGLEGAVGRTSMHWLLDLVSLIGGKEVAGSLILIGGIGMIVTGFLQLAKGQRVRRRRVVRWQARYRPNN